MPPPADGPAAPVPFLDLAGAHRPLRQELQAAFAALADSGQYILGPAVADFETEFARFLGVAHAVGCSSGTDALLMGLMALGVGPGHEVITTPFTFVACAEVVARVGARVVLCDLEPDTLLLDPARAAARLSPRTKALLPVHLFGRMADPAPWERLAQESGAALIEDCAQSIGARWGGRAAGSIGRLAAFSFFPTKNLGALGDAGLVATGDAGLAEALRQIRDHGARERDAYVRLGGNFRLDTLQAALLRVKLPHLPEALQARRAAAARYHELVREAGLAAEGPWPSVERPVALPPRPREEEHACNLFVVRVSRREPLRAALQAQGIATAVYYPRPIHLQPLFAHLRHRVGDFPVAEEAARTALALPLYPGIPDEHQRRVVAAMAAFYRES